MERYYQPEIETASREQIKAWQDERLVKQVKHVWDNVPYYRKKMEAQGVTIKTCGTCLNYYHLTDALAVGEVTNMYDIVETLSKAAKIIKP